MTVSKEVEIKLEVPSRSMRRIEASPLMRSGLSAGKERELVSVYFDTDSRKLRRHGVSLRVRHDGKRRLQTVKTDAGAGDLLARGEWEREIDGEAPDLKAARGTALDPLLGRKLRRSLKPVFETRVRRIVVPLRRRNSAIELTLDRGRVQSDARSAPICEVELELKRGDRAELFDLVREVAKLAPVSLAVQSKAERGYALIENQVAAAAKAPEIAVSPRASTGEAFRATGAACIRHLAANEAAVRAGQSEGVHQMRVALRRLRAAISLFAEALRGAETERIKHELKWLTGELSPARDLDVFVSGSVMPLRRKRPPKPGAAALQRQLERRRGHAFARAKAAVESQRYRTLVLDTLAWLEAGDWTRDDQPLMRARRRRPAAAFAADVMSRRRKKVLKNVKRLEELPPLKRHKLRIAVKKLRYAADFFAGLFPGRKAGKRRKAFERLLGDLQDCLGDLNDISVHEKFAENIVATSEARRSKGRARPAFAVGMVAGQDDARIAPLMRSAAAAGADFTDAKPFWR